MRVKELERCLRSIDSKQTEKIEVIVSEDCSPQRDEICKVVNDYAKNSPYHVVLNKNEHNLGYDRNLRKLISLASGEYVMYLSDDDCLFPGKLDEFIQCLEKKPAIAYGSFWYGYRENISPVVEQERGEKVNRCWEPSIHSFIQEIFIDHLQGSRPWGTES